MSAKKNVPPIAAYSKWQRKCFQHRGSELWNVKLQHQGRRETFALGTANRAEAGVRARQIFMSLRVEGWDKTLSKYKPGETSLRGESVTTVGDLCTAVERIYPGQKRSIKAYAANFRRLVADIAGIDRSAPGWSWRAAAIELGTISRRSIETWRTAFLDACANDLERQRSARASCNSIIRMSKVFFTQERMELVGLTENPFAKVKLLPALDHRFRGGLDAGELVQAALSELAEKPELLKIFLLALCCGLRRSEIDRLEWSAFNFDVGTLHIGATRWLHPKSEKSIGDIDLDPELVALLRGFYARRLGEFVIESKLAPQISATYPHYRCDRHFWYLNAWLRDHGVRARSPIHTLRKLFGSLVNDQYGLHAASLALRHANVATTAAHYVSKRARVTVGLGDALAAQKKISNIT